jgi:hypothetical protein
MMVPQQGRRTPRRVSGPGRRALERFFKRLHAYERNIKEGRDVVGVFASIYRCLCLSENGAISVDQGRKLARMYSEILFKPLDVKARAGTSARNFALRSGTSIPSASAPALVRPRR